MAKITAPVEGYTGNGPGDIEFTDGKAETTDPGLIAYFRNRGYGVDGSDPVEPGTDDDAVEPDYDEPAEHTLGTPLRDAAVDPQDVDFLPPTNSGEAHPHSRKVVAPGLHAGSGMGPVAPGVVSDDVRAQEAKETSLVEAIYVDGDDVPTATRAVVKGKARGASATAANGTSDTTGPTKPVAKKTAARPTK